MKKKRSLIFLVLLIISFIIYIFGDEVKNTHAEEDKITNELTEAYLEVHYLDVGQADSIFIEINDEMTMLIDAGTNESSETIINYINSLGYNKIDYLIATHPHADHIGGMEKIVEEYEIGNIYMPKVTTNTKTYENLLEEIDNKNLKIKTAESNVNILNGNGLVIDILSPVKNTYDDLNNYSVVLKITYKNVSYLFMGDAEEEVEQQITEDIDADIIKVGHHGSNTSSSIDFLKRVSPTYAIISVGEDNSYSHPHDEILKRYKDIGANVYRTDLNGTITVSTDGNKIAIDTEK